MDTIYIHYTSSNTYSNQGSSPSGKEGYDIWLGGDPWIFLGWVPLDELPRAISTYMFDCYVNILYKGDDEYVQIAPFGS